MNCVRPIILAILAAGLLIGHAQTVYREPDFKTVLFDQKALSSKEERQIEWARALTAVARNFHNDITVSPRAKAMGLVLTLQLRPYDRDAVIGSYHLRRLLEPTPTAYYPDKAAVIALLESVLFEPATTGADRLFQKLITVVLDELLDRERSDGLAWRGTVMPPARPLKRSRANVIFMDGLGATRTWTASARIDESARFSVEMSERPVVLTNNFRNELKKRYPYFAEHLQLTLGANDLGATPQEAREFLISLFVRQMADGWKWDPDLVLCALVQKEDPSVVMERLDAYFQRQLRLPGALLVPSLPVAAFRDWMAFDQMHRVLATEFVAVTNADEVVQWHSPTSDREKAKGLFDKCQAFIGRSTFNRLRLANHQGVLSHLKQIRALEPTHLSASVLWTYANLRENPGASLKASQEWLNTLAKRVMVSDSHRYTPKFKNEVCEFALSQMRNISPRLDAQVKPLASALLRFIEKRAIPFCGVKHKETSTGRLQFRNLISAISEWRRLYNESQRAASPKTRRP